MKEINCSIKFYILFFILFFSGICFPQGTGANSTKYYIYSDKDSSSKFLWTPSGWMPNGSGIGVIDGCQIKPIGKTCIKLVFEPNKAQWVGVYWLPDSGWKSNGINVYELLKGKKDDDKIFIKFSCRGEKGGEKAIFKIGGVDSENESLVLSVNSDLLTMAKEWKEYSIDLSDEDLSHLVGGFSWNTDKNINADFPFITIYVDEIYFEKLSE